MKNNITKKATNKQIKQMLAGDLKYIFNQFMQETVNSIKLNLMPPIDKVPEINNVNYSNNSDTFEICFEKIYNKYNKIDGIDFSKDSEDCLITQIKNFSHLTDDNVRENLVSTIKSEIGRLSEAINTERDIDNYIVDKRVLLFLTLLIQKYYIELKKVYINNASESY